MTNAHNKPKRAPHSPRGQPQPSPPPAEDDIYRLEDLCVLADGRVCIADHANGILIYENDGKLLRHLNGPKDTLAFGVRSNPNRNELIALILDEPGWAINIYDTMTFDLLDQIMVPTEPQVPRLKLRWLAIDAGGTILVTAGGFVWKLENPPSKEWSLLHKDNRQGVWFSLITKTAENSDRYLVCYNGDVVVEASIGEQGFVETKKDFLPPDLIHELGTYTLDSAGNMLVSDWASGDIFLLNNKYELQGKIGNAGEGEPSYMSTHNKIVYVGCKQTLQVKAFKYLDDGSDE